MFATMDFDAIRKQAIDVEPLPAKDLLKMSPRQVIALSRRLFPAQKVARADWLRQRAAELEKLGM